MIFNSLGSNYTFKFVIKSLFSVGDRKDGDLLKLFLADKYGGEVVLLYKNREALGLALSLLNLPRGSRVGINGFTCYVVYQAIKEEGLVPVYLDIEESNLNFSFNSLRKAKDIKVLIVQNTLGNPCEMEKISSYCRKNGICLIEDLAHSVGIRYGDGKEAGTVGDFAVFSFSQDKIIDAVSGGALIIRNKKFKNLGNRFRFVDVEAAQRVKDRFYPLLTYLIRKTYFVGLGKLLHLFLKKLNFLSQPMGKKEKTSFHKLPDWYSKLVLYQLDQFGKVRNHRDSIAKIYSGMIEAGVRVPRGGSIRFPALVDNRAALIEFLKKRGVYVSDIWYDAPIAPKKYLKSTGYNGQCPNSEEISKKILNLPTHINVSKRDAQKISVLVNKWLNTP
jgi:perosamine synthetase